MEINNTISFILCAQKYNSQMEQTFLHVMEQFHKGDEILLVVDQQHIKSYPQNYLEKMTTVVEHDLKGLGAIRNKSVQMARCEYIAFVDDDTSLGKTWRESMLLSLQHENTVFTQPFRSQGQTMFEMNNLKPFIYYFDTAGCLIKKEAILNIGNFDSKMQRAEDTDLASRLVYSGYDASVAEFCVTDNELTKNFNWKTFFQGARADALLYLKAGIVLEIKNALSILSLLLKMRMSLFSQKIWFKFFTFYWVFTNKGQVERYKLSSRRHDVLIVSGGQVFRVQSDVRLVFSPSEIRLIKVNQHESEKLRNISKDEVIIEKKGTCSLFRFKKDEADLIKFLVASKMITPLLKTNYSSSQISLKP